MDVPSLPDDVGGSLEERRTPGPPDEGGFLLQTTMTFKLRIALGVLAVGLVAIAPAGGALVAPAPVGPAQDAQVDSLPAFSWNPVSGADRYEFELAADQGFNSTLSEVSTKNTRAALKTVIPNGTYYWRVRAVASGGALGTWSTPRKLEMKWTASPALLAPAHGATISYPQDALKLRWTPLPGAAKYEVRIATDPNLGSLVGGVPVETAATSFAITAPLSPGVYYWGITPLNAEGHAGTRSATASFTWQWPSTTTTRVTDLVDDPEVYDPQFSWDLVPGAAGYEVEVNYQEDWAPGSKVCCAPISSLTKISTLGTSLSPAEVLPNNEYYWRVRAIDASGHAGAWNAGPSFTKTFANVPPMTAPSVKNLRVVDGNLGAIATGSTVATPVVLWDPVPGASAYQVGVTPFSSGCDWGAGGLVRWDVKTTTTGWTPLGWSRAAGADPLAKDGWSPSTDLSTRLAAGEDYCVRVRPVDRASTSQVPEVIGDWTYLPANGVPAFTWSGPPVVGSGDCGTCEMTAEDYMRPAHQAPVGRMPVFTWNPVAGAESYFVIVARDASFTNIVDYAFTRVPAYAPREGGQTKGYSEETTSYFWAVLPADNANGSGVFAELLDSFPRSFVKRVEPSTLLGPVGGSAVNTAATTFRWTAVEGARYYRVEVASDPNFSELGDDPVYSVKTDSTAYTSDRTFPSDRELFWRVRADAEDGASVVGLTWSETGTFRKQLPKPVFDADNPSSGAGIPSFSWNPVPGAVSYDVQVREADGDDPIYKGFATHAASFVRFTGVGVTQIFVRAKFPTSTGQLVDGPWSEPWTYTHTIPEPEGPTHEAGANRLLLSWSPRPAADEYRVQVSQRPDFATMVENTTTQTTAYAPLLTSSSYTNGGTFWWRVAMVDTDRNVGNFTTPRDFTLPKTSTGTVTTTPSRFTVYAKGYPVKNRYRTVSLRVRNQLNKPVYRAAVRVSGAGVGVRTKYTNNYGWVSFRLRATRYPSMVAFRITKSGYTTKTFYRSVRLP
jgi:hypothetical protein